MYNNRLRLLYHKRSAWYNCPSPPVAPAGGEAAGHKCIITACGYYTVNLRSLQFFYIFSAATPSAIFLKIGAAVRSPDSPPSQNTTTL